MVKVSLKGGVWKNSEDEILKAAVQKYGKQQWARVASLLNRKTAKQAKARWHEWLDPSNKKTEWSRAEEEKLLHLAKLLPAQWKTIGPLVGRTATQCQEQYEKLLDQAAAAGAAGGAATADATTEALRQQTALRPGQIDAHPETRPARPDPIDMDEDEMEMLQEARARLANTVGKKAKRKQREKMLAQAKRLADLQKRRELKQAGLLSKAARKRSGKSAKEIDLGVEIPFHKPAPAGFHATDTEDTKAESLRQKRNKSVDYQKLNESQYRSRDREMASAKKREENRLRVLELTTEKYAQQKDAIEEQPARPRVALSLPEPAVKDQDWHAWQKEQAAQQQQGPGIAASGVTAALLGDYTDRPLPTPLRTPGAAAATARPNLQETATALRELERGRTPLLTSGVVDDEEEHQADSKPASHSTAAATPLPVDRQANRTPARRDALGLNREPGAAAAVTDDNASVGASTFASSRYYTTEEDLRQRAREERRALKAARQQLEAALAALPAPQFEYELAAPAVETVDDDEAGTGTLKRPLDQADIEKAERDTKRRKAAEEYESRSSVLKRSEQPRPAFVDPKAVVVESKAHPEAAQMVRDEMLKLLQHDAYAHPVVKKKDKTETPTVAPPAVYIEAMDLSALQVARSLLETEADIYVRGKAATDESLATKANQHASVVGAQDMVYHEGAWHVSGEGLDRVASLQAKFAALQEATAVLRKRNNKMEAKLTVVTGGYAKRAASLKDKILEHVAAQGNARSEEAIFGHLQQQEVRGGALRVEKLGEEVAQLKALEASLQKEYGDVKIERRRRELERNQVA
jgi:pre-mRNA-splicing factor CDC5/CEF1